MLAERQRLASAKCENTTAKQIASGGWCLRYRPQLHHGSHSGGPIRIGKETLELPTYHYPPDALIVAVLAALLTNKIPSLALDRLQSIIDFGAGVGQYGHALKSINPAIDWRGYDGAGNVESYTNNFVRFADLTMPLSFPKADWVLSLEVGEHMLPAFEFMFLRNLHAHQTRGIIGSWARLSQVGTGHVNNHNRSYVKQRFLELGYKPHEEIEDLLTSTNPGRFKLIPGLPVMHSVHHNLFAFVR